MPNMKAERFMYNMSEEEAQIRAYIRAGLDDAEIYRMLQIEHEITQRRYEALKKSARKKVWLSWRANKNGKNE